MCCPLEERKLTVFQKMVTLECFSPQSKLPMHLHCCSKHWHKVVIPGPWVITRSHKCHQWNWDKEIIFGCIAICWYFKSYCWSAFSFSPQGSCSWCAAQCSILRIPMQNPGCHPESMLESKHTEPNKQQCQGLWERPNTQLPGGLRAEISLREKALQHDLQMQLCLLQTPL